MRRTWVGVLAGALVLSGTLAACGDDDESDAGSSTTNATTEAPSGDPVKVLFVGSRLNQDEPLGGLEAAVDSVNAAGGIQGRPVEIVKCEDEAAPADCIREAVSDEDLIASVSIGSGKGDQINPVLEEAGLAGVGTSVRTPADFTSPVVFPVDGGGTSNILAEGVALADHLDVEAMGVPVLEIPASVAAASLIENAVITPRGLPKPVVATTPAQGGDPSAQAGALIDTDGILTVMPAQAASAFIVELRKQGYENPIMVSAPTYAESEVEEQIGSAATNLFGIGWFDHDSDGYAQFTDEMDEYADDGDSRNELATSAWLAMHLLADVAEELPELSRAAVLDAFTKLTDYDTNGLLAEPLDYTTPGEALCGAMPRLVSAVQSQFLYEYLDGAWERVEGVDPINPFGPPQG